MIVPPPTPNRPLKSPPTVPIPRSLTRRSRVTGGDTTRDDGGERRAVSDATGAAARLAELVEPMRGAPADSAGLLHIDGAPPPILAHPQEGARPPATPGGLPALASRLAPLARITGRPGLG